MVCWRMRAGKLADASHDRNHGHHAIRPSECERGKHEHDVDDDLPLQPGLRAVLRLDKTLQQMDRRNADQRRGELHLQHSGIHMAEPLRLVGMTFEIEARHESFVAADDDHDEKICDHDHVDQPEHRKHDRLAAAGETSLNPVCREKCE